LTIDDCTHPFQLRLSLDRNVFVQWAFSENAAPVWAYVSNRQSSIVN
jgi:hypothetical protein